MGVLGLHNEAPPSDYSGADSRLVCEGLALGERATAGTLRAVADCLQALASMDDTVATLVTSWSSRSNGHQDRESVSGSEIYEHYTRSFAALRETVGAIDRTVKAYQEHLEYATGATAAGRGLDFQAQLMRATGDDFDTLVFRRIEGLRKLKVRIKLLQEMEQFGRETLQGYKFAEFFLLFMQPLRDIAIAAQELYVEVLRGALASHQSLFRVGRLEGWADQTRADSTKARLIPTQDAERLAGVSADD